ncbi:MAG TPA: replicative DNA helicase [bacterium]|nr:replicative DNA helicase [Chlamydiota bacterium]HOE27032.1 replicative DNA helicase [bacterium]HQM52833.1 replicative DNA helicase [bacterium]
MAAPETVLDKLPPQNLDAEMGVLGAMLLDREAIGHAIEAITADSFYKGAHAMIFSAVVELFDANEPVDIITLSEHLKKRKELEAVGGASYISALLDAVPSAANVSHHLKIVREKALLRRLIAAASGIVSRCYDGGEEVNELLDEAEREIFDIAQRRDTQGFVKVGELIKHSIETVESLYQKKEYVTGVPTGYTDLDTHTAGFQPSDLIIIAARPSMGKTSLALNIAEHAAIVGKIPTAVFSLEMAREQLVLRMLCSHARVSAHNVRTGFISEKHDFPKLVNAAGKLAAAPIYIDDSPALSVLEMRAKARRLAAREKIGLVIVDYLQLMRSYSKKVENRQQEISEISRSLKALARELAVPVIVLSQLNREAEARPDHRPRLSDLRESGAIEQDADVVLLLFREEYYEPDNEEAKGRAEVIIAKQRNGPVGNVKLTFLEECTHFENYTPRGDEEGTPVDG